MQRAGVDSPVCVGSSLGGSVALTCAADDIRIGGVATLGSPTEGLWSRDPDAFLAHAREVGAVHSDAFPGDNGAWTRDARSFDPIAAARSLGSRPLLVLQGSEDDVVPMDDARALAEAGGERTELHVVYEAGHQLRHDPRAVAVLLGWLDRV